MQSMSDAVRRPCALDAGPQGLCVTGAGLTGTALGSGGPDMGLRIATVLPTLEQCHMNRNQGLAANQESLAVITVLLLLRE